MKDSWQGLRAYTQARIAQGRAGSGLPTDALLEFQLAHAAARDAVHKDWNTRDFAAAINAIGQKTLCLATPVPNRTRYLQRPDLGRQLDSESRNQLKTLADNPVDLAIILSNGLSSTAIETHGLPFLKSLLAVYANSPLHLGPICLVPNGRVALSDEIGSLLKARLAIIIVGERPGLSASDSLGAYMTYAPSPGNTDANRNCISNIRPPEGLSYALAAAKLRYLSCAALDRGYSGVELKDDMNERLLLQADN